jgi:hypothetical protein
MFVLLCVSHPIGGGYYLSLSICDLPLLLIFFFLQISSQLSSKFLAYSMLHQSHSFGRPLWWKAILYMCILSRSSICNYFESKDILFGMYKFKYVFVETLTDDVFWKTWFILILETLKIHMILCRNFNDYFEVKRSLWKFLDYCFIKLVIKLVRLALVRTPITI